MKPAKSLLTPEGSIVLFIDHEPQMYFGVTSHNQQCLKNNVVGLAKAAKVFNVETVLTTIDAKTFSGLTIKALTDALGTTEAIDRTTINSWEDAKVTAAVNKSGKKKLIISALWTELCALLPALSAKEEGYEVYVVADACGGATKESHDMALQRMIQAGVIPVTWEQVMLEWQRDWAKKDTGKKVLQIATDHGGSYGIGIEYANSIAAGDVTPKN